MPTDQQHRRRWALTEVHSRIAPYGVAIAAAALAAGANAVLWPNFGIRYPLIAFYPAITISAWLGGLWPGVVCTVLSATVAAFVWLTPRFSPRVTPGADAIALLVFIGVGVVISALSESLKARASRERDARERAEDAEALLATQLADTQRLYKMTETVVSLREPNEILRQVLHAAIDLLRADDGHIESYDESDDHLKVITHIGVLETQSLETRSTVGAGCPLCGEALRLRRQVIVEDAACDPRFRGESFASTRFVAGVSAPILGNDGTVLGMLSAHFGAPHRPSDRELRFLDLYLQQGGQAIERSRLLDRERLARHEAERANRLKDHFLSTVSHDLRTPLNAVIGWADLLRTGHLSDAKRARAVQAIYDNAQRQGRLIGDLLDVSRIMSGKLRLERSAIDICTVVQGAVDVVELDAADKAIDLVVDQGSTIGAFQGDAARIQQVVWNLLANAVKFTPRGGAVHVQTRRHGQFIEIVVRDTGIGIRREFLPLVFEPFRQADASTTASHGGLGLGLSIVKYLVEAHGGTVHAESDGEGQGAVFTVRLPVHQTDESEADRSLAPHETEAAEPSLLSGDRGPSHRP